MRLETSINDAKRFAFEKTKKKEEDCHVDEPLECVLGDLNLFVNYSRIFIIIFWKVEF